MRICMAVEICPFSPHRPELFSNSFALRKNSGRARVRQFFEKSDLLLLREVCESETTSHSRRTFGIFPLAPDPRRCFHSKVHSRFKVLLRANKFNIAVAQVAAREPHKLEVEGASPSRNPTLPA